MAGRYQGFGSRQYTGQRKTQSTYTGPTRAAINRSDKKGWVDLHTPYDKNFVQELKDRIQPSHRQWNPGQGVWHVNELFLDVAVELTRKFFNEVTTDLLQEEPKAVGNMFVPVLQALAGLPNDGMDKVYKTLAMALHPDVGGSNELMTKLNQAYQEIRK